MEEFTLTDPVCRRVEADAPFVLPFGAGTFFVEVTVLAASVVGRERANPRPAVAFLEVLFFFVGAREGQGRDTQGE